MLPEDKLKNAALLALKFGYMAGSLGEGVDKDMYYESSIAPVINEAVRTFKDEIQLHRQKIHKLGEEIYKLNTAIEIKAREQAKEEGTSLEELELSPRNETVLKNLGIDTIEQVTELTANQLLKTPNYGRKSLRELQRELEGVGLRLAA